MIRQELIERIKRHEARCSLDSDASFGVAKVVELADGVLAVRETDGEHTVYFDKSKYYVRDSAIADISSEIRDFPIDTGFIEDVTSRNWQDVTRMLKLGFRALDGKIKWHKEPVPVKY